MLSRIIKSSLIRAFSTSTPAVRSTSGQTLINKAGLTEAQVANASHSELKELEAVIQSERNHLAYYVSDIKEELNDRIDINFQKEANGKTLIYESLPDGTSNSKLAEILVLGSVANLWNLLLGFPSYLALGGTLGVAALGAVWSYSNYLRRSSPQLTQIYLTADGKWDVHYLKPGFLNRSEGSFTVDASSHKHLSFGCNITNYLRKNNRTAWVSIDGKLFWYSANANARVNNHHLQSML